MFIGKDDMTINDTWKRIGDLDSSSDLNNEEINDSISIGSINEYSTERKLKSKDEKEVYFIK